MCAEHFKKQISWQQYICTNDVGKKINKENNVGVFKLNFCPRTTPQASVGLFRLTLSYLRVTFFPLESSRTQVNKHIQPSNKTHEYNQTDFAFLGIVTDMACASGT